MILTGSEIEKEVKAGKIIIDPFDPECLGPNSYDIALGPNIKLYELAPPDSLIRQRTIMSTDGKPIQAVVPSVIDPSDPNHPIFDVVMPESGLILWPDKLYLAHTVEAFGSDHFVPRITGRSSFGRYGVNVHCTAGFGDLGYKSQWTLEITVMQPILLRPGMRIAQAYFYEVKGEKTKLYRGKYLNAKGVIESRAYEEIKKPAPPQQPGSQQKH